MATFLNASDVARIYRRIGARRFWARLVDVVREDFARWAHFDKSPRFASHSPGGVIELMPVSDGEIFAFKFVNGHPGNTLMCLQTVVAFGALADVATGYPIFLSEMTLATAFRTAATLALAARHLARPQSRTMALIGLGAQSEFQACAFKEIIGVDRLRVFDVRRRGARKIPAQHVPLRAGDHSLPRRAGGGNGRGYCDDHHRRQETCDDFDGGHDRAGNPHQRRGRRLPRQDGAFARPFVARAYRRRICAANAHRG